MTGGNGDDTYVVDSPGDKVTEGSTALAGHDTVEGKITYTLGANVEDLDLSAGGAINGTGNALANLIIGSAAANKLDGKAGADTMNPRCAPKQILTAHDRRPRRRCLRRR